MTPGTAVRAVSFDLFGTLVSADRPERPAESVAAELAARGVDVPPDWAAAYAESHCEVADGAELPLVEHVAVALASRDAVADTAAVQSDVANAVRDAFDADVRTRPGAAAAVASLAEELPVGVLSNCSVHGLAGRALERSAVDGSDVDAVVTSVGCGWRKPDPRAFAAVAERLGVGADALLHVGDDPRTDGGAAAAGGTALLLDDVPIEDVPERAEAMRWG